MRRPEDKYIAGIDLHGNNLVIGIINQHGERIAHRKLECELEGVMDFLKPFKPQLQSMAVESTFNWYWLVDGLRAEGYRIDLANPAQIQQYSGIKHADDKHDAFHLAELQRLKILPKAHVYDPVLRPVRDLLRRRTSLVHQRTALYLRACPKIPRGLVFAPKAGWRGATKENILPGSSTEEQRSQAAFGAKTLRAAGLLSVACVGSVLTARVGDARTSPPWPQPKSLAAGPRAIFGHALNEREPLRKSFPGIPQIDVSLRVTSSMLTIEPWPR